MSSVVVAMLPVCVTFTEPPAMLMLPSALMPLAASAVVVTVSVPSDTMRSPVFSASSLTTPSLSVSSSTCKPSSPTALMVTVPPRCS